MVVAMEMEGEPPPPPPHPHPPPPREGEPPGPPPPPPTGPSVVRVSAAGKIRHYMAVALLLIDASPTTGVTLFATGAAITKALSIAELLRTRRPTAALLSSLAYVAVPPAPPPPPAGPGGWRVERTPSRNSGGGDGDGGGTRPPLPSLPPRLQPVAGVLITVATDLSARAAEPGYLPPAAGAHG